MSRSRPRPRPLLIAAEGLDGAGKSVQLDLLARWLERKGRAVSIEAWEPSRRVERASAAAKLRPALTPRVAALLAAADAARRLETDVRRPLAMGSVVLADRYAWTAIAREVARGLEPEWVASLYRFALRPDLLLFFDQPAADALESALARREWATRAAAISAAFGPFLGRMVEAFEALLAGASEAGASGVPSFGPWPVPVVHVRPGAPTETSERAIREAVRPFLAVLERAA